MKWSNARLGIKREAENELVFSKSLRFVPLHLTRYLELRESCWELCDSQRLWKSQFSKVFTGLWVVFSKLVLVFEETTCRFEKVTCCLCNFVGHFSDFFPWNFENVRWNWRKMPKVWNEWAEKDKTEKGEACFDFLERRKSLQFSPFCINISPLRFFFV